jgi:phosphoribosylaminoimidazolecarboxamide formyltransferase/IMP cyclohydrolase
MADGWVGERAILSLSDTTGAVELARRLVEAGLEIVATPGTARHLAAHGLATVPVEAVTGFPSLLGGRVKTLHPAIHAGILAREDVASDRDELRAHGIKPVRVVAVTLYPFEAGAHLDADARLELVDVGGVALLRAAAKNHRRCLVLSDPAQYPLVYPALLERVVPEELARRLAAAAFQRTAAYDAAIAEWLRPDADDLPATAAVALRKLDDLRYGENPQQRAAWYRVGDRPPGLEILWRGRDGVSANNLRDAAAAAAAVADLGGLARHAAVIVKHGVPSGAAVAATLADALTGALDGDREAAFGGIAALTSPPDGATAAILAEWFFELVVIPAEAPFPGALAAVLDRRPRLRVLRATASGDGPRLSHLAGGVLLETPDTAPVLPPTPGAPDAVRADLEMAWRVVAHARSNAVVLAKGGRTLGIGQGQVSRVRAVRQALQQAGEAARGAVLASDGFFPFPDAVGLMAEAGVVAAVAPRGSRNDALVAKAAADAGLALIFADERHFRH